MQILFVDESGTPPAPGQVGRNGSRYFVLGGVIVPAQQWRTLSNKLTETKRRFRIDGEIKWRHFVPGNKDRDNPMRTLPVPARNLVRETLLAHLGELRSIKLLAVVVDAERAYRMRHVLTSDDLYEFAYKPLTERFQYFLQDMSREVGSGIPGIIVADHRGPRDDTRLRNMHQKLLKSEGRFTSSYGNLVEGLFLAPSDSSVGIQYADLVAGSVYRSYTSGDNRFFDLLRDSFRKNPNTGAIKGYGLVHQPNW